MTTSIPRVAGHPLFGSLLEMRDDRVGMLTRIAREYGDIAAIRIGMLFRGIVVSAPELCHEVLTAKADAFTKGYGLSVLARPVLGDGLLTSEGDAHRRQRKLISPAFVHARIAGYARTIAECVDARAERMARRQSLDLSNEMMELTLDVVGRTLFGADLGPDAAVIGDSMTVMMQQMSAQIGALVPMPPAVPTPANLRSRKHLRRLDEVVYRLIRERRASGKDTGDFLSMLLAAGDQDGKMTDKEVRDEAMTLMLAGHETTANALAWAFYLLGKHPEVRQRLEAEVDSVLAGALPGLEHLPRLPFASAVFKEAMRLYPPAYLVVRRAARNVTVGGYQMAKGDLALLNVVGMHRRPEYFREPERFIPDRFAPESEAAIPRHAFLPFGAGPRVCIGNHFALMEGQIGVAHLAQRLRFELEPRSRNVGLEPLITLRPRDGVHVKVLRRDVSSPRIAAGAA